MPWSLDTQAVNAAATQIVLRLGREPLEVYRFLRQRFEHSDATRDSVFQFVFRSFYRVDNAGLTDAFKERYFQILEQTRHVADPDIRQLTLALYEIPNRRGLNSLQFSFVTKLANTINSEIPVYDSEVAAMYGFSPPQPSKTVDLRLDELCEFHQYLREDYNRITRVGALAPAIGELESAYGDALEGIGPTKTIDFLLWAAGKLRDR